MNGPTKIEANALRLLKMFNPLWPLGRTEPQTKSNRKLCYYCFYYFSLPSEIVQLKSRPLILTVLVAIFILPSK